MMLLFSLFLAVLVTVNSQYLEKPLKYDYPYPVDNQDSPSYFKCPDDNWVIGKFDGVVYCYRPFYYSDEFPEEKNVYILKNNYCRHLNQSAHIGNIHSIEEMMFLRSEFLEGVPVKRDYGNTKKLIVGVYKQPGTHFDSLSLVPLDNVSLSFINLLDKTEATVIGKTVIYVDLEKKGYHVSDARTIIDQENAAFLCKTEAVRRETFEPVESKDERVDLYKYECGDNSSYTEVAQLCGQVVCLHLLDRESQGLFRSYPAEFNECGEYFPGGNMVSIHCNAANEYIRRGAPGIIGLYRPYYRLTSKFEDLKWQDGSVLNYLNMQPKEALHGYHSRLSFYTQNDVAPYKWKRSNGEPFNRICATQAKLKEDHDDPYDEDWVPVPTKTGEDGVVCANLGRGPHATQCPDTTWIKQQIGNETYCYRPVFNENGFMKYIVEDSACEALHKTARVATLESEEESDFMRFHFSHPSNTISIWGTAQVCKMKALPINKCPKPFNNEKIRSKNFECPEGWVKFKACNKVSCYKTYEWLQNNTAGNIIADNDCGVMGGGAHINHASIHCDREDRFVRNSFGKVLLPLKFNGTVDDTPQFYWTDNTDFNYIPLEWNSWIGRYSFLSRHTNYRSNIDFKGKVFTTSEHGDVIWNVHNDTVLNDVRLLCKQDAKPKQSQKSGQILEVL